MVDGLALGWIEVGQGAKTTDFKGAGLYQYPRQQCVLGMLIGLNFHDRQKVFIDRVFIIDYLLFTTVFRGRHVHNRALSINACDVFKAGEQMSIVGSDTKGLFIWSLIV